MSNGASKPLAEQTVKDIFPEFSVQEATGFVRFNIPQIQLAILMAAYTQRGLAWGLIFEGLLGLSVSPEDWKLVREKINKILDIIEIETALDESASKEVQ